MPRTTVDIDGSVLRAAKKRAAAEGKSLGQVISELLAGALREPAQATLRFTWVAQDMRARLDIDDKDALYRALDAG